MTPSAHDVLGVARTATPDEIHSAYRRLAKRWHPDRCPRDPSATRRLQALSAAYAELASVRETAPPPESLVWHASRDAERILLTTTRLCHEQHRVPSWMWQVARWDIRKVTLTPARWAGGAVVRVEASASTHQFELPSGLAAQLAELLSAPPG